MLSYWDPGENSKGREEGLTQRRNDTTKNGNLHDDATTQRPDRENSEGRKGREGGGDDTTTQRRDEESHFLIISQKPQWILGRWDDLSPAVPKYSKRQVTSGLNFHSHPRIESLKSPSFLSALSALRCCPLLPSSCRRVVV